MELRTLRYFLAIANEEGINRAADALHVTQPTLSRQMAQLEEDLGVTLFVRGTRKITLTNEGILFRRRAEEILSLVEKTEKEVLEQEKLAEGKIFFGCGEIATVGILPELIKSFSEKYPRVTYDINTATADVIKDQMEKGLTDIGVLLEPIDMEKFDFIRFEKKEKWVVLMREDDPLAKKDRVTADDLKSLPLILPCRPNVQNELSRWFGDSFKEMHIMATTDLKTNASLLIREGLAREIAIDFSVPNFGKPELVTRPLEPELSANSVIAWKKSQSFSLAVEKFIELVKEKFGK